MGASRPRLGFYGLRVIGVGAATRSAWNPGYWGPHIGFYGGVNYGYGYTGTGYEGGYWNNGAFFYNRSVNNVTNVTNITNVYNKTVINNVTVNNVSYNGGQGGTNRPTDRGTTGCGQRAAYPANRRTDPAAARRQHQPRATGVGEPWQAADRRDCQAGSI